MSTFKNTTITLAGSVIPAALVIATLPLYLEYIGEERYGVLAVIWVLLGYFSFFDFGLGRATARRMAQITIDKNRSKLFCTVFGVTIVLGALGGSALFFLSDWILTHLFTLQEENLIEVASSIKWLPSALVLILLNSLMVGALQAQQRFVSINIAMVSGESLAQLLPLSLIHI